MLSRIFIQNFALIDSLAVELKDGLQVITGETGAGKSIILGALRLILGERADLKAIQNADAKSVVEVEFQVSERFLPFFEEHDLDFDTTTIIRRELLPNGKSRAFINDVPTNLEVLKLLGTQLIDIHSQFETANLFNEKYQFELLDGLSENKNILPKYQTAYHRHSTLERELHSLQHLLEEGIKESDYKKFLLEELQKFSLENIDLRDLEERLSLYENAETISENLSQIFALTDQDDVGFIDAFLNIKNRLNKAAELSHQFTEPNERLQQLFVDFKDLLFELQNKAEHIEVNAEKLEELNAQLNSLHDLFLKHHVNSVEELISIKEKLQAEQSGLEHLSEQIEVTEKEIKEEEKKLTSLSKILADNRKKAAPIFTKKIEALLKQLGLEKAKMAVELKPTKSFHTFGKESIAILFQANSGFPLNPIQTAISGGERSRVMLAIKKIVAENAELPTLILDEIDTGVSGKVADEVGKMMQEMAKNLQLIVITHLAQVAAKGNNNYKVMKKDTKGKTETTIITLSAEQKLQEIAQLLSGSKVTDAALQQAEELMK